MPRKTKGVAQADAEQVDNAGRNGEVSQGRSLRARKVVDYSEREVSPIVKNDLAKSTTKEVKKRDTKGKDKRVLDKETAPDASGEGTSRSQENGDETNASQKGRKAKATVSSKESSLNSTFVVSGKNSAGEGKTSKRNAEAETKQEEDQPEMKKPKDKSGKVNETCTDYSKINFNNDKTTANGEKWNLKISSWNVDGVRAWLKKDGAKFLDFENPDILCLQETKVSREKIPPEAKYEGYHAFWDCGEKEGYSGVAVFCKREPIHVRYGMDNEEHDREGRLITLEYEEFYLVTTYVPNSGKGLVTLPKRLSWNAAFQEYVKDLDTQKPVIICGDMNVSHQEIDIANPKTNTKNAGFTKEEREGMTELLGQGFIDTYRHIYPKETGAYSFWTYMRGARSRNIGWRLDYFIVSERIIEQVCDSIIRNQILGSDHCPITLLFHNKVEKS